MDATATHDAETETPDTIIGAGGGTVTNAASGGQIAKRIDTGGKHDGINPAMPNLLQIQDAGGVCPQGRRMPLQALSGAQTARTGREGNSGHSTA